jgi:hypothetical protein
VVDAGAGLVELETGMQVRYVDPAGATQHEPNSWHYPTDDTSSVGQAVDPIAEAQKLAGKIGRKSPHPKASG